MGPSGLHVRSHLIPEAGLAPPGRLATTRRAYLPVDAPRPHGGRFVDRCPLKAYGTSCAANAWMTLEDPPQHLGGQGRGNAVSTSRTPAEVDSSPTRVLIRAEPALQRPHIAAQILGDVAMPSPR